MGRGFRVSRTMGGKSESFGNVLVEFARGPTVVVITRDRGQWTVDIGRDRAMYGLHILATAMSGTEADPGPKRSFVTHSRTSCLREPDSGAWFLRRSSGSTLVTEWSSYVGQDNHGRGR